MTAPINASPAAATHTAKHADRPLNPAQQARAADPAAKGAAFGALVSGFAKAKHAPVAPVETPPAPVVVTPDAPSGEAGSTVSVTV